MSRLTRSILTCMCTTVVCTASAVAAPVRTVVVTIHDMNEAPSLNSDVFVRTSDGVMTEAIQSGLLYAVKGVGDKVAIEVVHPQYGSVSFDTTLPMIDPVHVEIRFTAQNRAILSQLSAPYLSRIAPRVGSTNQVPGAEGGGCAGCTPIGEGVVSGNSCGNSEADITSCAFNDTVAVWFCYTASCDGTATASTCDGSGYDTALSVWDACGGTELACNDDDCPGFLSSISWAVTAGTTYYLRLSGFNGDCGDYALDVSCEGGGGCGNCDAPTGGPGCSDQACQDLICDLDRFCCDMEWDQICADAAIANCDCGGGDEGCGDCDAPTGGPGCSDQACQDIVCGLDPFCCDVEWDQVCADAAIANCDCGDGGGEGCDLECPAGALDEGEACGSDTNGGCNSTPPAFTDAECGDTFCGTAWADGDRDTDWYLVNHGGGILTATLTSQFAGVCFIVDGIGACAPVVAGDIGCSDDCSPIADASADLPAGQYVVFVSTGNCDGSGIFTGIPCGGGSNDYTLTISCEVAVVGACCLPDNSCVDGVTQEECEDAPGGGGGCGNCGAPTGGPGCSDQVCQDLICGMDAFCCDVEWDAICADAALANCDCDGGGGGLGGVYQGDDSFCEGPTCIPLGGCCQCDENSEQFCTVETEEDCAALGGAYLGDDAACEAGGGQVSYDSSPNVAIPDNSPAGVSDTISVGDSFTVLDLEVQIEISHTWIGDLCVSLSKDGGTSQLLMSRIGADTGGNACHSGSPFGCSDDNMNVVLDDDAGSSIENQCAAGLSGTYAPDPGSLASFIGGDSAGSYTLNVVDNAAGDIGTFVSWSLIFTAPAAGGTPCEDAGHDCITNEAPDCSAAFASSGELWPPFHAYHDITVEGVTDPDGDPVTITITGIFQDEPVNSMGMGDGNTCPDGTGVGTSIASVRAERNGRGDGRVYHISYTASDGQGGECDGTVTVCVPHSQIPGDECVDQGPLHDSTNCGGGAAVVQIPGMIGQAGNGPATE